MDEGGRQSNSPTLRYTGKKQDVLNLIVLHAAQEEI